MTPPTGVFVLADQLRASALGCYGDRQVSTPNVDAFAADGLRCENAYAPHPMCTPARASIQTGTHKFDHGAIRNWAPLDVPPERATLGRSFRDRGYSVCRKRLPGRPHAVLRSIP